MNTRRTGTLCPRCLCPGHLCLCRFGRCLSCERLVQECHCLENNRGGLIYGKEPFPISFNAVGQRSVGTRMPSGILVEVTLRWRPSGKHHENIPHGYDPTNPWQVQITFGPQATREEIEDAIPVALQWRDAVARADGISEQPELRCLRYYRESGASYTQCAVHLNERLGRWIKGHADFVRIRDQSANAADGWSDAPTMGHRGMRHWEHARELLHLRYPKDRDRAEEELRAAVERALNGEEPFPTGEPFKRRTVIERLRQPRYTRKRMKVGEE